MRYEDRGVSADKHEVHEAIQGEDPGLYPGAFCKVLPDLLGGSEEHCMAMHADGAGTKSILAYLSYRENGDPTVFQGISQDAVVMNLDDMACSGFTGPFLVSNTIGRNAKLLPGEVIAELIAGYRSFAEAMAPFGIELHPCGGETADLGDSVRTLVVDCTLMARSLRSEIIGCENLGPDQVIVGLESGGRAAYESKENSGIGSNGLTAVRHELLSKHYKDTYPEVYAPEIADLAYTGRHRLDEPLESSTLRLGEALLSPTRSYAPVIKKVLEAVRGQVTAIFNNTGGGQTKCLRFGQNLHYIKDNLFEPPPIFRLMQTESSMTPFELYRTLNMGHRLEFVCRKAAVDEVIDIASQLGIEAKAVGRTEAVGGANKLTLTTVSGEEFVYSLNT